MPDIAAPLLRTGLNFIPNDTPESPLELTRDELARWLFRAKTFSLSVWGEAFAASVAEGVDERNFVVCSHDKFPPYATRAGYLSSGSSPEFLALFEIMERAAVVGDAYYPYCVLFAERSEWGDGFSLVRLASYELVTNGDPEATTDTVETSTITIDGKSLPVWIAKYATAGMATPDPALSEITISEFFSYGGKYDTTTGELL